MIRCSMVFSQQQRLVLYNLYNLHIAGEKLEKLQALEDFLHDFLHEM